MPRRSDNRDRILDTAYQLFYERGFSRISMDAVAARAGITKRTLYNHFDSKDALFGEMLERQSGLAVERIKTWATQQDGSAEDFIATLFERLAAWSAKKRWEGSGFTRLALELADLPGHPGRTAARRHKAMIERVLAEELRRRGLKRPAEAARALQIVTEGATILTLIHGDRAYVGAAAEAAQTLIKRHGRA